MFEALLSKLAGGTVDPLPAQDARLALAALMVRVARADGVYDAQESAGIARELAQHYGLSGDEAEALRAEAEVLESEAPDTVRFTREVKDTVPHDERAWVLEALWSVALADGQRDHEEDSVLRLVASLLGVRDRDSALARQRAADREP